MILYFADLLSIFYIIYLKYLFDLKKFPAVHNNYILIRFGRRAVKLRALK